MAGFNQYQAIPGHKVKFLDGNLNLRNDNNAQQTESVVFLGTATDGPVGQPIKVTPDNAYQIFGNVTFDNGVANGSTLLPAFEEAWQAGIRDVRLMRVTGKTAKLSLKGTSYTVTHEEHQTDNFVAHGNASNIFELPHGGIDNVNFPFVVKTASGYTLQSTEYTIDVGVAEDTATTTVEEVKAVLTINQDVVDMESDILVSYTYKTVDSVAATETTYEVIDNNTDSAGNPMIAIGYSKAYNLTYAPKTGLRLYVNDVEVLDTTLYTVDAAAKTITIHATSTINLKDAIEVVYAHDVVTVKNPEIKLEAVSGGILYNKTSGKVEYDANGIATITFTKPDSKKGIMSEAPLTFKSTDYANFKLLINAINTHPQNNVFRAKTDREFEGQLTDSLEAKPQTYFSGGLDELSLSNEELYKRLGGVKDTEGYVVEQGAYQLLENYRVDYVVPLGVYADSKLTGKYDNFAYQLALGCAVMSHYNQVTIGVIASSTPDSTGLKDIEDHVRKLEAMDNTYYMRDRFGAIIKDGDGDMIDLGQFIQVTAGPDLIVGNTRMGLIASNSNGSYVGFVGTLPVQSAPTNKALPSVAGLRFEYSTSQINRLTQNRFVTFRIKPNGQVGVVDAMTAAHAGSDYTRLSTARIVKEAVNQVREVADPFIGEPNDVANRNALASALDKRLGKMVEAKALLDFDFQVVATPQMELIGEASIELSLRAPNELRRLTTIVSLEA